VVWLATSERGLDATWGAALCLVAAVYASGVVSQKPLLHRVWGLQFAWLACSARPSRAPVRIKINFCTR
jgi:hypothetical protein